MKGESPAWGSSFPSWQEIPWSLSFGMHSQPEQLNPSMTTPTAVHANKKWIGKGMPRLGILEAIRQGRR